MAEFAKIFTTTHGQLLLTRDGLSDEDDGTWVLTARGEDYKGVQATMAFTFSSEAELDAAFESGDQEKAENTAATMRGMLVRLMGGEDDE